MQQMDLSLIGALGVAVTALAGVVTYMGRWFVQQFELLRQEVIECRRDREKLWERIADLSDKIDLK